MTLAPRYFATWIPALPKPPDAPITSTQSPDFSPAMSRSMLKATGALRATTVRAGVGTSSRRITSGGPNSRMTMAFIARGLGDRVRDERLRHRLAPLRAQPFLRRQQLGPIARVEHVGVGPVLVHPAPRILPVVVDLAADDLAPDAPHVPILARLAQVIMAAHNVVDALHFEREVVQSRLRA